MCRSACSSCSKISIHALCEEGDVSAIDYEAGTYISIHALCEEGDEAQQAAPAAEQPISIHALCEEGDPRRSCPL